MVNQKQPQNVSTGGPRGATKREMKGPYARTDKGRKNSGVVSADPRVLSGKEDGDATWPLKQGDDHD